MVFQSFFSPGAATDKATCYKWRATVSTSECGEYPRDRLDVWQESGVRLVLRSR